MPLTVKNKAAILLKLICCIGLFTISIQVYGACTGGILPTCTCTSVTAGTLAFGSYNPINASVTNMQTTINVTCQTSALLGIPTVSYVITLTRGRATNYNPRTLCTGAGCVANNILNYNIFTSNAYSTIWGDNTAGTGSVSDSMSGSSQTKPYTAYGRITASQTAAVPGSYTDGPITVTVTY